MEIANRWPRDVSVFAAERLQRWKRSCRNWMIQQMLHASQNMRGSIRYALTDGYFRQQPIKHVNSMAENLQADHLTSMCVNINRSSVTFTYILFPFCVHRTLRYVSYQQLARWCWGYLGRDVRVVLPSCAVSKIRETFPSDDSVYIGFKI